MSNQYRDYLDNKETENCTGYCEKCSILEFCTYGTSEDNEE